MIDITTVWLFYRHFKGYLIQGLQTHCTCKIDSLNGRAARVQSNFQIKSINSESSLCYWPCHCWSSLMEKELIS